MESIRTGMPILEAEAVAESPEALAALRAEATRVEAL
jgi:hypothetical protein